MGLGRTIVGSILSLVVPMIRQKLIDTVPHEVTSLYPTLSLYPVILLYPVTLRHPATLLYCTLSYTT